MISSWLAVNIMNHFCFNYQVFVDFLLRLKINEAFAPPFFKECDVLSIINTFNNDENGAYQ